MKYIAIISVIILGLSGCATSPPKRLNNLCHIFDEKPRWYKSAAKAQQKWGSSIPTMMAIMHQESRFVANAKPPRTRILWVIPGPRKSSSYGYSQAKKSTWKWYQRSTKQFGTDRNNFADAIDFIGWYNTKTNDTNKVKLSDTYHLYLAYHEGHGGFKKRSYNHKAWLKKVAKKVSNLASSYTQQLAGCEASLKAKRSGFWPF